MQDFSSFTPGINRSPALKYLRSHSELNTPWSFFYFSLYHRDAFLPIKLVLKAQQEALLPTMLSGLIAHFITAHKQKCGFFHGKEKAEYLEIPGKLLKLSCHGDRVGYRQEV